MVCCCLLARSPLRPQVVAASLSRSCPGCSLPPRFSSAEVAARRTENDREQKAQLAVERGVSGLRLRHEEWADLGAQAPQRGRPNVAQEGQSGTGKVDQFVRGHGEWAGRRDSHRPRLPQSAPGSGRHAERCCRVEWAHAPSARAVPLTVYPLNLITMSVYPSASVPTSVNVASPVALAYAPVPPSTDIS